MRTASGLAKTAPSFAVSDWFAKVTGQFDLIVSNPPYVSETEYERLSAEIRNWEPKNALTLGGDGTLAHTDASRKTRAAICLDGGRLLVEISPQLLTRASDADIRKYAACMREAGRQRLWTGQDRVVILRQSPQNL